MRPSRHARTCGSHAAMRRLAAGTGDRSDAGDRVVECFVRAADGAGLPAAAELR